MQNRMNAYVPTTDEHDWKSENNNKIIARLIFKHKNKSEVGESIALRCDLQVVKAYTNAFRAAA